MTTDLTPEDERVTELLAPLADIPPVPHRERRSSARRPWLRPVLVAGGCLLALGVTGAAIVTSGGGGGSEPTPAAGTTAPATTPPATTATATSADLGVFFVQDGQAARVPVPDPNAGEPDAERRAVEALLAGEPAGYTSEIPAGTTLESLEVADSIATVGLSGGKLNESAREQVVATLLDTGSIRWVRFGDEPDLYDRAIAAGKGDVQAAPVELDRAESSGQTISFAGTANVFEANVQLRVVQGTEELAATFVTATCGTGCRGSFEGTIDVPAGTAPDAVRLEAFTMSAEDGSVQNVVGRDVTAAS